MQSTATASLATILHSLACLMLLRVPVAHESREFSESIEGDRTMVALSRDSVEVWGALRTGLVVLSYVAILLGYMLGGV